MDVGLALAQDRDRLERDDGKARRRVSIRAVDVASNDGRILRSGLRGGQQRKQDKG
jgi:hypothetical protein